MYRLYTKSKLTFALVCIAAYVLLFPCADKLSASLGMSKAVTAPFALALALLLLAFLRRHGLTKTYGLCAFRGKAKDYLWFLPLALILSANLWGGVSASLSAPEIVLYVVSMLCVGFIEELLFRGFLFGAMRSDSLKAAVIVSSLTFGLGHIINLLRGAALAPTLLQICYASAIGFLFTVIYYKGKSLVPCIIAHSVFNALSVLETSASPAFRIALSAALCLVSVGYALWILKKTDGFAAPAKGEA